MKKIKLAGGQIVLVDNQDMDILSNYQWHLSSQGYARTQIGRGKFVTMHRMLNETSKGLDTDHINQNKLDNRRKNLRTVTRSLNTRNAPIRKDNTSGHKGIDFYKRVRKWRVRIGDKSLGYFDDLVDAIIARKSGEKILWTN